MMPSDEKRASIATGIATRAATIAVALLVEAALLFGGAGRMDWAGAWVYFGITLVTLAVGGMILLRASPETIAERGRPRQVRGWDMIVSGVWLVAAYLVLPLLAGLDVRYGWTATPGLIWPAGGAVMLAAGYGLTVWAMHTNAYFSTAARIQDEREHTVCSSGPYRTVRHPGYVGYGLQYLAMPFLLGSWWALLPALVTILAIAIRTELEDRMLQAELPGYREYVQCVRYRLVPVIW